MLGREGYYGSFGLFKECIFTAVVPRTKEECTLPMLVGSSICLVYHSEVELWTEDVVCVAVDIIVLGPGINIQCYSILRGGKVTCLDMNLYKMPCHLGLLTT